MADDKRRVWWGDFRAPEFEGIDPEAVIAVVPVAAIEQHGPHLPVSTDTAIMEGMLAEAIALLPADLDIRILPVQAVGKSNEHIREPGMSGKQRRVWWGDFRAPEFEGIDPEAVIAVVPVAAIEQHGPHLPVSTDTAIMEGLLAETIARLPADLDIRILPVQPVGKSNEHIFVPGTLTLLPSTLIEAWTELGASAARAGVRKIVFVNSHGGNEEVMGVVTRELRVRHAMMAVKTSWERFGRPEGLFSPWEERYGIHGGDVETSLMLHFRPELVDMAKAEDFPSRVLDAEQEFDLLRQTGKHAFAWVAGDLNPHGVVGNATAATAEKGRATAQFQAEGFVRLLQDIRKAKLKDWLA